MLLQHYLLGCLKSYLFHLFLVYFEAAVSKRWVFGKLWSFTSFCVLLSKPLMCGSGSYGVLPVANVSLFTTRVFWDSFWRAPRKATRQVWHVFIPSQTLGNVSSLFLLLLMNFDVLQQVSNLIQALIGVTNYPQTSCLSQACRCCVLFRNRDLLWQRCRSEGSSPQWGRGRGRSAPCGPGGAGGACAERRRGGMVAAPGCRSVTGPGRGSASGRPAPSSAARLGRPGWPQQPLHERLGASRQRPGGGAGRAPPRLRPGGRRKRRWRWWRCRWCPAPCVFPSGVVLLASHVLLPGGFLQRIPQDDGEYGHPELAHLYFAGVLDRVHDCKYVLRWVQRPGKGWHGTARGEPCPPAPPGRRQNMGRGLCTALSFVSRADNLTSDSRWYSSGLEDADSSLLAAPPWHHIEFKMLVFFVISFSERKQIKIKKWKERPSWQRSFYIRESTGQHGRNVPAF